MYPRNMLVAGLSLVLIALGVGWLVLSQRDAPAPVDHSVDLQRATDLQALAAVISRHYEDSGILPTTLSELVGSERLPSLPSDPATQQAYAYEPEADGSYALCAVFDAASDEGEVPEFWMHEAGRYCFRLSPAYGEY